MKPELTVAYLHSIQAEPLPRFVAMSEEGWLAEWKAQADRATDYESWPSSWVIPQSAWDERLKANWARLVEYDRLTAERMNREPAQTQTQEMPQ